MKHAPSAAAILPVLAVFLGGCEGLANVRRGSDSLMTAFAPPTPAEAADLALDEFNPDNRYRGISMLANAPWGGEDVYVRLYERSLDDPDGGVRSVATRALGIHGSPEHAEAIMPLLESDDAAIRAAAARALQRLHNPDTISALIARLTPDREIDPGVRAEVALALGQYREPLVLQALIASLQDVSLAVNHNTRRSLETLTGQDLGDSVGPWVDWANSVDDPFAAGRVYTYPGFERDRNLLEWLPFVPPPPYEPSAAPVGMPRQLDG